MRVLKCSVCAYARGRGRTRTGDEPVKEKMQRRLFIILFLVPTLIAFVLFYVYPLITVFVTTLCKWDYQNLNAPELLPLDDLLANYRYIFTEYPYFKTALVNSLKWALCGALIATPIALITALVTSWKLPGWKWMKNIYIIPNIISAAAIGLIFLQLYNPRYGLLTLIVQWFRPEFKESILLIQPQNFWAMTLGYILFQGTASIMLLGQISSVPQEVYEAAKIDGATGFKLDWYITIPCIKDMIKTVVILTVTGGFMLYNEVYFLTKGAAGTTSLAYILRELSVVSSRMQYARANVIGVVQIVGGLLLIGIINLLFKIDLSVPLRKIALWRSRHEEKKQNP